MTIAAGLKANDAILLCADTELLTGYSNFSKSKISKEQISPTVYMAFTYSGPVDFSNMAIEEISSVVKRSQMTKQSAIISAIKDKIHEIYSESIGRLPEFQQDGIGFNLLIAIWAESRLGLIAIEGTTISEESHYRCIGTGKYLGKFLIRPLYVSGSENVSIDQAATTALWTLEHVKANVPGCGELTELLIISADGTITHTTEFDYRGKLPLENSPDGIARFIFPVAATKH